jgi:uncharacterized membrane protein
MAKLSIAFGVALIILGVVSYFGTGSQHPTALIPTWFGLALGVFGFLAISPNESRRKLFMHINVTIGLIGFLGAAWRAVSSYGHARSEGVDPDKIALAAQAAMAGLLLVYVLMCVKSFVDARRQREL